MRFGKFALEQTSWLHEETAPVRYGLFLFCEHEGKAEILKIKIK